MIACSACGQVLQQPAARCPRCLATLTARIVAVKQQSIKPIIAIAVIVILLGIVGAIVSQRDDATAAKQEASEKQTQDAWQAKYASFDDPKAFIAWCGKPDGITQGKHGPVLHYLYSVADYGRGDGPLFYQASQGSEYDLQWWRGEADFRGNMNCPSAPSK